MKKTLLLSAIVLMSTFALNAQTVWNLGGDATLALTSPAFPLSAGIGNGTGTEGNPEFPVTINGLAITGIAGNTNMGAVNASEKPFGTYTFPNRFQFNGGGYAGANAADETPLVNMPVQRYLSINVSGNSTIYVIGVTGSSSSDRKLFVTDGTNLVGSVAFPASSSLSDGTVTYTGGAATLYLFCNAACNLTYLSATNVILASVKDVLSDKGVSFNGTEISNTKNATLEVYNILGKKVISSTTSISTKNFVKGVYVVRIAGSNETMKISL
jgi:hypothetical protein